MVCEKDRSAFRDAKKVARGKSMNLEALYLEVTGVAGFERFDVGRPVFQITEDSSNFVE